MDPCYSLNLRSAKLGNNNFGHAKSPKYLTTLYRCFCATEPLCVQALTGIGLKLRA